MAENVRLNSVGNLQDTTTAQNTLNANNTLIEQAFSDVLSREGNAPNQMLSTLDMNSNQIINLPSPGTAQSPVRLVDINSTLTPTPAIISGNNVYTGSNSFTATSTFLGTTNFTGNAVFKSGEPWADVVAFGADPIGNSDSYPSIQAAINFIETTYGGGTVFLPPGVFKVSASPVIPAYVTVQGSGRGFGANGWPNQATVIKASGNNSVMSFDQNGRFGGLRDVCLIGGATSIAATSLSVAGADHIVRDLQIYGGGYALSAYSVDTRFYNIYCAASYGNALVYTDGTINGGANFFLNCKFDTVSAPSGDYYGFYNVGGASEVQENYFTACDFSGDYTYSLYIRDLSNEAVSSFDQCIFSSPIAINGQNHTRFVNCQFGGGANGTYWLFGDSNPIIIVGCDAYTSGTAGTASSNNVIKSGNWGIN